MPPREEYQKYLEGIWEREYVTNNGPLVRQLEKELKEYLKVENLLFVSNGTIALQLAIKALGLTGEIITTPFSYVATTSSIVWEGCKPVFVDIEPSTLNINPDLIESAITNNTTGILVTHVYGNPCDIEAIQKIADAYSLKVIYDAAHCFGTKYKGRSVFEYGNISITSFHATKLFHTVEGGAVFAKDKEVHERLSYMRNFGHTGPDPHNFDGVGINGKNSEFHAAMGLTNLKYIQQILENRKKQCKKYLELFSDNSVKTIKIQNGVEWNYAYFPIMFEDEEVLLEVKEKMEQADIYPRRYFYPSLDTLKYVSTNEVKVAKCISERILCLPLFDSLKEKHQNQIFFLIKNYVK